ncbi:MAG: helix-turn-helix domain-containing protein [Ignavibacteria bacterium]|nr:helix-turn-helix domain-containing protein [Ignavibacteria bacterium]
MRFTLLHIIFFLLLFSSGFGAADVFNINFTQSEKTIDANPDDWDASGFNEFSNTNQKGSLQNKVKFQFAWDEQNFYGIFIVFDKQIIKIVKGMDNPDLFLNDAMELYLDTKNDDEKNRMDLNDYQFIFDALGDFTIFKGDKNQIKDTADFKVPKDFGTANILMNVKTSFIGSVNNNTDKDSLYIIEFSIPFSSIGVSPVEGYKMKMGVCLDDRDSRKLSDTTNTNGVVGEMSFMDWNGKTDFGYPADWKPVQLTGKPDFINIINKKFSKVWLLIFSLTFVISISVIFVLYLRINKLKNIPVKNEIKESSLLHVIEKEPDEKILQHKELFDKARKIIEDKIEEKITAENLAKELALSLRQLQRIFKDELNTTPTGFITLIKLEKASEMLKSGKNVTEAAFAAGFSDSSYFSRVFKKYFGVPPSDFTK